MILYSTAFLEKFKGDAKTKWAAYIVLAHEIGHHLNNHNLDEKDIKKRKTMELEADKFAGAICRTLGATLNEALAGMESIELPGETATHPPKSARVAAIANGWKKQDELLKANEEEEASGGSSKSKEDSDAQSKKNNPGSKRPLSSDEIYNNLATVDEECETKNVGDYCFENTTKSTIRVRGDVGYLKEIYLAPGQTLCYYNISATNHHYQLNTWENGNRGNTISSGEFLVEKCKSKTFVIK